ncbi:hypothetical protein IG631_18400 [Alternaria alternata]|nr:hypothetical protein IG631_18400 [Alternaria alternata]
MERFHYFAYKHRHTATATCRLKSAVSRHSICIFKTEWVPDIKVFKSHAVITPPFSPERRQTFLLSLR